MKRLLFVINDAHFFNTTRLPIAIAAQKNGYEVHIATKADSNTRDYEAAGFAFHPLPLSRSGKNPFSELKLLLSLILLFRKQKPDLVHCISIKPVLYGGIAARVARVPALALAVSGLGTVFLDSGIKASAIKQIVLTLYRAAFRHKNCFGIFQNPSDQDMLCNARITERRNCRLVRGSGIDLSRFVVTKEPSGLPRVLFAARLLRDKGFLEFVEAGRIVNSEGVKAEFVVAGDIDPDNPTSISAEERDAISKLPFMTLLGERSDMEDIYAQTHITALPSYREGLPRVLCEAGASGRAVVTTDVPGCRDAIEPGVTGLLVPPRNASALATAISVLLDEPQRRQEMGREGRRLAEASFDRDAITQDHLKIYDELLKSAR